MRLYKLDISDGAFPIVITKIKCPNKYTVTYYGNTINLAVGDDICTTKCPLFRGAIYIDTTGAIMYTRRFDQIEKLRLILCGAK